MNANATAAALRGFQPAALETLLKREWPIFPCGQDKRPLVAGGFKAATFDPMKADVWARENPDALVGVPTGEVSGFDVLDIDPRNGGMEWFNANRGRLPVTRTVRTRGGGLHLFLRHSPGLRCSAGSIAPGVDVRADGGLVIDWASHGCEVIDDSPIADWAVDMLADAVRGRRTSAASGATPLADRLPPSADAVVECIDAMDNPADTTRDGWVDVCLAARGCIIALDEAGIAGEGDAERIGEAAIRWSERWPLADGAESAKWESDFSQQDVRHAGWQSLLRHARRFAPEGAASYAAACAAAEFDALPPEPEAVKPGRKLRLLTPADCAASPPRGYVVKGFLAPGDFGLVFGEPGSGKSVVCPHIGYAVAQGRRVFGRRVKQGTVFYVPAEDPHGMRQRVAALRLQHGDGPDFRVVQGVHDLFGPLQTDADALRAAVAEHRPVLVIIDTLAAAAPGLQENESADMARVFAVARSLTRHGAAVILVHHTPKGGDTPRGHGNLTGDADVTLHLVPDAEAGCVWGTLRKNRNGPSDRFAGFAIRAVTLGTDADGDSITAPIADEGAATRPARDKLSPMAGAALAVLRDMLATQGRDASDGRTTVAETDWRAACDDRRVSAAPDPKNRRDRITAAFRELRQAGRVEFGGERVWEAGATEFPLADMVTPSPEGDATVRDGATRRDEAATVASGKAAATRPTATGPLDRSPVAPDAGSLEELSPPHAMLAPEVDPAGGRVAAALPATPRRPA